MQREEYKADLRLLKLGGRHIVLGVDWMRGISPISFDFNKMEVTPKKDGRKVMLQGYMKWGHKMIKGKKLQWLFKKKMSQVAQLFSIEATK